MKNVVIGGGPGGLYFSLLTKKARPDWQVCLYEQNKADDTFGFGVVFSDDTLDEFLSRDMESYEGIRDNFAYWDDIVILYKGNEIRCAGNGFAGCSRVSLLKLLQARCEEVGVDMHFEARVDPTDLKGQFPDADIILASDGIASPIREHYQDHFKPQFELRQNKFVWLGSSRPLDAFHYFFKETEHGVICAHSYQYEPGLSTFIFEMSEDCWRAHGFEETTEQETAEKIEKIYAEELQGHGLLTNRSIWRNFPRVFCENWYHENIVILGDAKATAHYSIGSGTKLAMECAIALSDAVLAHGEKSVQAAFEAYDQARRTQVQITQHNADVSLAWFEHMERSYDMEPMQFSMVVMARAKSITYDNLHVRDSSYIDKVNKEFLQTHYETTGFDCRKEEVPPMFTPFRLRDMTLNNRVVVSPMAQYSATDGLPSDWHFVHYSSRAMGGAGLVFVEMTCPSAEARITPGCTGLWNDEQMLAWKRIVDFVHENSQTKLCMQLGHAGRKGSTQLGWEKMDHPLEQDNWPIYSASPLPYFQGISQVPEELNRTKMDEIRDEFVHATKLAQLAGFDMVELHAAHGYLLASFLSPLTNQRTDNYGGNVENRLRYPLEVFSAMRRVWPSHKPMSVRISACDWQEHGMTEADSVAIAKGFAAVGCDLIDVSAGQTVADQKPVYGRMFQTQFSEAIKNLTGLNTMAVGNITEAAQVNTIVACRRADLVALARPHLWNPYFTRQAAAWYGADVDYVQKQYDTGMSQAYREQEKSRQKQIELQVKAKPSSHK
ncbi:MAG: bifunctional salicylyl-CoA 5-hydroxylase/oxidoreductase [Pseudomonadota bacterium]